MTAMESMLVGALLMLFAAFFVAFGVLVILAVRQLKTAVQENSSTLGLLARLMGDGAHVRAAESLQVVATNIAPMVEQVGALARMMSIFNNAMFQKQETSGGPDLSTLPRPTNLGQMFAAVPADEGSSFSPYDEEAAARREALREARAKGVNIADEVPRPPSPSQMVNAGEAQTGSALPPIERVEAMPGATPLEVPPQDLSPLPAPVVGF